MGGVPVRGGITDKGHGSIQGMGYKSFGGVPDMGWDFRQRWDTRHRWGSRHAMMGILTGDDGATGRVGVDVTTLTSHKSCILHSFIFLNFLNQILGWRPP